ncbi:MAG: radical SAM protein [Dehalococcoidia bacterium]
MAAYRQLYSDKQLHNRVVEAVSRLASCTLCPRRCQVDRLSGEEGKCHTGRRAVVSSCGPHFGEEGSLVGSGGSGTIFFAHCNLRCIFCQNHSISQTGEGVGVSPQQLSHMMLSLQQRGCHNINLVSPSHVVPQILEALELAAAAGLSLPLVYNTGGYDSVDTLRLLDGVVDIYMPDMKYADEETARRYSGVGDYPRVNQEAVREMHRQVGDLETDGDGVAVRGLLVRHLVLPGGLGGTRYIARFLVREVSPLTYVNVMAQYHPAYRAREYPELSRSPSPDELREAIRVAQEEGLSRLDGLHTPSALRLLYR